MGKQAFLFLLIYPSILSLPVSRSASIILLILPESKSDHLISHDAQSTVCFFSKTPPATSRQPIALIGHNGLQLGGSRSDPVSLPHRCCYYGYFSLGY